MKSSIERLLVIIIAARASRKEITELRNWLITASSDEIERTFAEIEDRLGGVEAQTDEQRKSRHAKIWKTRKHNLDFRQSSSSAGAKGQAFDKSDDFVFRIVSLLRDDAGLSVSEATSMIRSELKREGFGTKVAPPLSKRSFEDWVRKLCDQVPPSVLMHIASRIRNRSVHGNGSAWPLKSDEE